MALMGGERRPTLRARREIGTGVLFLVKGSPTIHDTATLSSLSGDWLFYWSLLCLNPAHAE